MQFTCNKCRTRNVIDVNPHAYHAGTVFVQCGGCSVKHKLVDNLGVAFEGRAGGAEGREEEEDALARLVESMPEYMRPLLDLD